MAKYQIWNKSDRIITPIGEVLSPAQWIDRYPMAGLDNVDIVIGGGTINGCICMEYTSMIDMYKNMGVDFTGCTGAVEFLQAIEDFENLPVEDEISPDERIASALEAQVMLSMPDDVFDEEFTDDTTEGTETV